MTVSLSATPVSAPVGAKRLNATTLAAIVAVGSTAFVAPWAAVMTGVPALLGTVSWGTVSWGTVSWG